MSPLVSIIIPTYNAAPYIEKCLRSLVAQDYSNIEIIVVDDESTDGSADIAEALHLDKVKVLRLPHGGVSRARNAGIREASGKYIIFIDGDDWVEPDHLSTMLVPAESGIDCVVTRIQFDNEDGTPQFAEELCGYGQPDQRLEHKDFNVLFDAHQMGSPCDKLYRRDIIVENNILFDDKITYAEDFVFNLNYFACIKTLLRIHKPTYHYVKHTSSSSFRYHHNAAYIATEICKAASRAITKTTLQGKLIYQKHFVWAIINLFHKDCPLNKREKIDELRKIFRNPDFKKSQDAIRLLEVGRMLKVFLRLRAPRLLYYAFSLKKK
jgi:glycosyltransferase involved in cell wall biosynthesis